MLLLTHGCVQDKGDVMVAHVLSHQAGLQDFSRACMCLQVGITLSSMSAVKGVSLEQANHWDTLVDLVAKAAPSSKAGDVTAYHDIAYGAIVGGIVRCVHQLLR